MLKRTLFALIFVITSASAFNPERGSFDVDGGDIVVLHSGTVTSVTHIVCSFSIDSFATAPNQRAFVAIEFTSTEPEIYDRNAYLARVAAYRSEEDLGWRHEFTLTDPENRDSVIVAYKGPTDSILRMSLTGGWENGRWAKVFYTVGDMEASMIDVSDYPLVSWQVVATGVKGDSSCISPED